MRRVSPRRTTPDQERPAGTTLRVRGSAMRARERPLGLRARAAAESGDVAALRLPEREHDVARLCAGGGERMRHVGHRDEEIHLAGRESLEMRLNGVPLHLRPRSFFQTNDHVAARLYARAREWIDAAAPDAAWDLFCGVGGFALHAADGCRRVTGIEISAEAIASARRSAAEAGLRMLLISIDSHSIEQHERNRGLHGLGDRIREGLAHARARGIPAYASVTVNRLVHYAELPGLLDSLGFDSVIFSYPRRLPFGSSSLVYSDTSPLIDFEAEELVDSLSEIDSLRGRFHVMNPRPSIEDVQRHLRGEPVCVRVLIDVLLLHHHRRR